jgi:large subunit ribosomal protein L13
VDTLSYKTKSANSATVNKEWVIVDAEDAVLGRLCSEVARLIRGKHKPNFTPHVDCGDNVIVINAEKVRLTGNKWEGREHFSYTGYPGGQRRTTPLEILKKKPIALVEQSVKGMLPKNKLGRAIYKNLHVYVGPDHSHEAQQPTLLKIN